MDVVITDSIREIDEKKWNTFVGPDFVEQSHQWYRTIEDSLMRSTRYVFVKENNRLRAAACAYIYSETLHHLRMPFLEVKSPLGFLPAFFSSTPETTQVLVEALEKIQTKEKTKGILLLDFRRTDFHILRNQLKGYSHFPIRDIMYIDLNFSDFEDYLSSLNASARRSIRKTLSRAEKRWKIAFLATNEFSRWKTVACRLQEHMCREHNDYVGFLPEKFYDALEKNLKENAELLLFFKDETPLASGLALNSPAVSYHKLPGVNPEYRNYQAYFLLYYEGIKRALERRQKKIYFGPTTYAFKEKIGCKRESIFGFAQMGNPLLNMVLRLYFKIFGLSKNE